MAPELVCHKKYNEKVDVWSLGVITYQLLSGLTPFDAEKMDQINSNIVNKPVKFGKSWNNVSANAKDFIS
jgi:serine/threonine protein kinase